MVGPPDPESNCPGPDPANLFEPQPAFSPLSSEKLTPRTPYQTSKNPVEKMALLDRAWAPALTPDCLAHWEYKGRSQYLNLDLPPDGFPKSIKADMVWSSDTFQNGPGLFYTILSESHIQELEQAAADFQGESPMRSSLID